MFAKLYAKTRDTVESVRDVSETVRQDWPIMLLGLLVRTRGSIPEDYPEIREYEDREVKRLHREYLRRRWRDGVPQAAHWHELRFAELTADVSRRRKALSREGLARTTSKHRDDEHLLFVIEERRQDGGA
ncbi:MAG TPA: hypothetical protein VGV91_08280 [Rubrobacter sp.]|nr:hypothetical protein [Rubrobacter sp.]